MTDEELRLALAALEGTDELVVFGFDGSGTLEVSAAVPKDERAEAALAFKPAAIALPAILRELKELRLIAHDKAVDSGWDDGEREGRRRGRMEALKWAMRDKEPNCWDDLRSGAKGLAEWVEESGGQWGVRTLPPLVFRLLEGGVARDGSCVRSRQYCSKAEALAALQAALEKLAREGWEEAKA